MSDHDLTLNIEAYQIMAEILVTVRRIVHRGLEKAAGKTWYLDGCPTGVYERLVARKENEVAIDRFDREYQELISFATLDDLAEIVEFNEDLAHLLEGIAPEDATMAARFRQIETLRLKLDATVPFDEEDLETLVAYHQDFRRSLSKPKEAAKATETAEAAVGAAPAPEIAETAPPEPAEGFGTKAAEVDELGAEDVVTDEVPDELTVDELVEQAVFGTAPHAATADGGAADFGTAVVDSGVIAGPEAAGVEDEATLEAERAIASDNDVDVLRVLHREIMSVAEHVLKCDVDQEFPVWQTLGRSGWFESKRESLGLAPVERFYSIAEETRKRRRGGDAKDDLKAFVTQSQMSTLLLSLGEMFKRHKL